MTSGGEAWFWPGLARVLQARGELVLSSEGADRSKAEVELPCGDGQRQRLELRVDLQTRCFAVGPGPAGLEIFADPDLEASADLGLGSDAGSDSGSDLGAGPDAANSAGETFDPRLGPAEREWMAECAQCLLWLARGGVRLERWDRGERCLAFRWSLRRKQRFVPFIQDGSSWRMWWAPTSEVIWGPLGACARVGPDWRRPWCNESLELRDREAEEARPIPVDGVLDLHHFPPSQLGKLLRAYLDACYEQEIYELRLIHGKGKGHLRRGVHAILKKDPRVLDFRLGGMGGGQWGATVVTLAPKARPSDS